MLSNATNVVDTVAQHATTKDGFPKATQTEGNARGTDATIQFLQRKLPSTAPTNTPQKIHEFFQKA